MLNQWAIVNHLDPDEMLHKSVFHFDPGCLTISTVSIISLNVKIMLSACIKSQISGIFAILNLLNIFL